MEKLIKFENTDEERALFGRGDKVAKRIREEFGVVMVSRNGHIKVEGTQEPVETACDVVNQLLRHLRSRGSLSVDDAMRIVESRGGAKGEREVNRNLSQPLVGSVRPKTSGQEAYSRSVDQYDVVFCVGPAGSGKTYLAVAKAIQHLKKGVVKRLVLVRPAVEAGEKLGFLPGDYRDKVNPYVRPLYDALNDMLEFGQIRRYVERDIIEVAPLAYMRGRTLDQAFIILDEAQNTTPAQMKMFLTRMGLHSKVVVTGDVTQMDLPANQQSGLNHALSVLNNVKGIGIVELGQADIVRHKVVQAIVSAYAREEGSTGNSSRG